MNNILSLGVFQLDILHNYNDLNRKHMDTKIILLTITLLISSVVFSQSERLDQQIGVSLKASTNGFGGDLYYRPSEKFAIKAGIEYLSLNIKSNTIEKFIGEDINFSVSVPNAPDVKFEADAVFKTGALSLAVGYQPFKLMYITAGIAKTLLASDVTGVSTTDIVFAGYDVPTVGTITPRIAQDKIGAANVKINAKNSIMPYLGIGLGSYVPINKKVSFALELGVYYVGNYVLDYNLPPGLTFDNVDYGSSITQEQIDQYLDYVRDDVTTAVADLNRQVDDTMFDINERLNDFKFYPVLKFTIGFRAFEF